MLGCNKPCNVEQHMPWNIDEVRLIEPAAKKFKIAQPYKLGPVM